MKSFIRTIAVSTLFFGVTCSFLYQPMRVGAALTGAYSISDCGAYGDSGNCDDTLNAGETVRMNVQVAVYDTCINLTGTLSTADPYVTIDPAAKIASWGSFNGGQEYIRDIVGEKQWNSISGVNSAGSVKCFKFSVDSACPENHEIAFVLNFTDADKKTWSDSLIVPVAKYKGGFVPTLEAPDSLYVSKDSVYCIRLHWIPVAGQDRYTIFRASQAGYYAGTYQPIDTVSATTYDDSVPSDSIYWYYVCVCGRMNYGPESPRASGNIMLMATAVVDYANSSPTSFYFTLSNRTGVTQQSFKVYRSVNSGSSALRGTASGTNAYGYGNSIYQDTGLTCDSSYAYRFTRVADGRESKPLEKSGLRLLPAAPDTVRSEETATHIRLWWPKVKNADGYRVDRASTTRGNTLSSYGSIFLDSLKSPTDTVYIDSSGLNGSLDYGYYVYAYNTAGRSRSPALATYVSLARLPARPAVDAIDSVACIKVKVNTTYSVGGTPVNIILYRTQSPDTMSFSYSDTIAAGGANAWWDCVTTDQTYYYYARAVNTVGRSAASNVDSAHRVAPAPPDSFWASQGTVRDSVRLWWSKALGADSFKVYLADRSTYTALIRVATTADTFCSVAVPSDSVYYFRIKSSSTVTGESSLREQISGYRMPTQVPGKVTQFYTNQVNATGISFTCNIPSQPPLVQGFHLYRKLSTDVTYVCVDTLNGLQGTLRDNPPQTCPDSYDYKAAAFNIIGEGAASDSVEVCKQ